jgi:hypothetical protein
MIAGAGFAILRFSRGVAAGVGVGVAISATIAALRCRR